MKRPKLAKMPKVPKKATPTSLANYVKRCAAVKASNKKKLEPYHAHMRKMKSLREQAKKIRGRS